MEEKDYYITEEGYRCFTEAYHLKRGYCCDNGCKHCPYKNEDQKRPSKDNTCNNMNEIEKFNEWMLKIQNEHYSDNQAMTAAYKKINEKI